MKFATPLIQINGNFTVVAYTTDTFTYNVRGLKSFKYHTTRILVDVHEPYSFCDKSLISLLLYISLGINTLSRPKYCYYFAFVRSLGTEKRSHLSSCSAAVAIVEQQVVLAQVFA